MEGFMPASKSSPILYVMVMYAHVSPSSPTCQRPQVVTVPGAGVALSGGATAIGLVPTEPPWGMPDVLVAVPGT
jgi:hypothetical protein